MSTRLYNVVNSLVSRLENFDSTIQTWIANHIKDYVVESGTDNANWTWLKFNSGKCIAWYYGSYNGVSFGTANGSLWRVTGNWTITVPSGLFVSRPTITSNVLATQPVWSSVLNTSSNSTIILQLTTATSVELNVTVYAQCIGVWK